MKTRILSTTAALALVAGLGLAVAAEKGGQPQSSTATGSTADFKKDPRLNLSSGQERTIYQYIVNAEKQAAPHSASCASGDFAAARKARRRSTPA